jgi:DNA-directed RNA polymerase specialized sigma24 family protein
VTPKRFPLGCHGSVYYYSESFYIRMQTEARLQRISDFCDEDDYDLIGYMTLRADDLAGAELAWQEFYRRHFPYLFGIFRREYLNVFDEGCLEDLAINTLYKVFDKADTFEPFPEATKSVQRKHVRAWLGRIMANLLKSELETYKGLRIEHPDIENEFGEDGWDQIRKDEQKQNDGPWVQRSPAWTAKKLLFQEALRDLSERERTVLLVSSEYERPDRDHQKLPLAVSAWLAELYNTSTDNIRKIRERAKRKVREYVEERSVIRSKENQRKG